MATLQELINANPTALFKCSDGVNTYKYSQHIRGGLAVMYDGTEHELDVDKWDLVDIESAELDNFKEQAKKDIDHAARAKRAEYLTEGQDLTYANKRTEAEAFKAAGYPEGELDAGPYFVGPWPYVSSYKDSGGFDTGREAADDILGRVAQLAALDAIVENVRLKGKADVDGATVANIRSKRDAAVSNLINIGA